MGMSFSYFIMWLELSCFSHGQAAAIWAFFTFGRAAGNIFAGLLLDFIARQFPDHGPPSVVQFSVGSSIPFIAIIIYGLGESSMALYSFVFFVAGFCMSW